jgi:hypothetical protein
MDIRNEYNIDCPRCVGAYLEESPPEILTSGEWTLEQKCDGDRVTLQLGIQKSLMVGRHRQDFLKGVAAAGEFRRLNHLNPTIAAIACEDLRGTVLDGELTEMFNQEGELTRDTKKRISCGEFVGYTTWGVLFFKGEDARHLREEDRYAIAQQVMRDLQKTLPAYLREKFRVLDRVPATMKNLQKIFAAGHEGGVAKKLGVGIPIDKKDNRNWWKLKGDNRRTVDAFIVGVSQAMSGGSGVKGIKRKPNGKAATFTVAMMKDGIVMQVGKMSNLTDEMKEHGLVNFDWYRDVVVEMKVSGWNGQEFRYPRLFRVRTDKGPRDCQFMEQVGKE